MSTLTAIIVACLLGGLLSVTAAAIAVWQVRAHWVPVLVSYAIGALLGAVFLDILPEAFQRSDDMQRTAATVLVGILLFFVLEKLVLWRHCHSEACEAHAPEQGHAHGHGRSGMMITLGDIFHNFVDGILIGAAFLADFRLGVVTAIAIIAHEIPQEVGDFLILLHSGYSRQRAILLNLLASGATLLGGVLAYYALGTSEAVIPYVLALAAASMIYVAVADLIPGLHRRPELQATAQQVLLIAVGIGTVWVIRSALGGAA